MQKENPRVSASKISRRVFDIKHCMQKGIQSKQAPISFLCSFEFVFHSVRKASVQKQKANEQHLHTDTHREKAATIGKKHLTVNDNEVADMFSGYLLF